MFAVLAALVMVSATSAVGLTLLREESAYAVDEVTAVRARWLAEGCLARAAAALDSAIISDDRRMFERFDGGTLLLVHEGAGTCHATVRRVAQRHGALVPLTVERLAPLLAAASMSAPSRDSVVAAVLDWQDEDAVPREGGAEAEWYTDHGRLPPRNAPIRAIEELSLIRGLEAADRHTALAQAVAAMHAPCDVPGTLRASRCRAMQLVARFTSRDRTVTTLSATIVHAGSQTAFLQVEHAP